MTFDLVPNVPEKAKSEATQTAPKVTVIPLGRSWAPPAIAMVAWACVSALALDAGLALKDAAVSAEDWAFFVSMAGLLLGIGAYIGGRMARQEQSRRAAGYLIFVLSMTLVSATLGRVWLETDFLAGWRHWVSGITGSDPWVLLAWVSGASSALTLSALTATACAATHEASSDEPSLSIGKTLGAAFAGLAVPMVLMVLLTIIDAILTGPILGSLRLPCYWLINAIESSSGAKAVAPGFVMGGALAFLGIIAGPGRWLNLLWLLVLTALLALAWSPVPAMEQIGHLIGLRN